MVRRFMTFVGCAAAVLCCAAPAQAHGGGGFSELLTLDFRESGTPEMPLGDGAAGPVTSKRKLASGKWHLVIVAGSVSAFRPELWTEPPGFHVCGVPDKGPIFETPGVTNGAVGTDAEYNFGRPFPNGTSCPAGFPRHQSLFEMDLGSGFAHYEPVAGKPTGWLAHVYAYIVKGQGKPISFREQDSNLTDNYGRYKMLVLGKIDCDDNGWRYMAPMSNKNKSDCEKYFDSPAQKSPARVAAAAPFDDGMGTSGAPFE